jgi:phage-related protein
VTSTAPVEHIEDALKLQGDARVDLWEVTLKIPGSPTLVRFWNGPTRTWQSNSYDGMACQLQGEARSSDGQAARPTLTVINPSNIFGPFASEGYFDLAVVVRKRVLQAHFLSDTNIFQESLWICGRPLAVTNQVLTLELRSPTDMPVWLTPKRTYSPPDYPFVVLS